MGASCQYKGSLKGKEGQRHMSTAAWSRPAQGRAHCPSPEWGLSFPCCPPLPPPRARPQGGGTQTDSERSLLPTAQQQYGQLGFVELPFFCFFLKILGLNF